MAKSKSNRKAKKAGPPPINPRAPWKRSWNVLWGVISLIGELILIILSKSELIKPSPVQLVVLFISIPIIAHLIVSGFRMLLIASS